MTSRLKGFTIMEVMVVMALVLILIGLTSFAWRNVESGMQEKLLEQVYGLNDVNVLEQITEEINGAHTIFLDDNQLVLKSGESELVYKDGGEDVYRILGESNVKLNGVALNSKIMGDHLVVRVKVNEEDYTITRWLSAVEQMGMEDAD